MLNFIWAIAAIVFIPLLLRILLLAAVDVADVLYPMLSGSIVGFAASTFALARRAQTHLAVFVMFAGTVGGAAGWLVGWLTIRMANLNLFSITALAFDLIVGMAGAVGLCFFLVDRYASDPNRSGLVASTE